MEKPSYEEEISLKELIMMVVKNWKIIIAITVIVTLIGGFYAFTMTSPTYVSRIDGTISISDDMETKYGTYPFPTIRTFDYLLVVESEQVLRQTIDRLDMELSAEALRQRITINHQDNSTHYSFSVSAGTPETANELMNTLAEEFMETVNMNYKKQAIDFFIRTLFVESESLEEEEFLLEGDLNMAEALLEAIPQTVTLRRLVLDNPIYAASLAEKRNFSLNELTEDMMLEEVINPNYEYQERILIGLKDQIGQISIRREQNERLREELRREEAYYQEYRRGERNQMTEGVLEVLHPLIGISESATLPESPTAPNKSLILTISLILGAMLGVFVAFFKAYWEHA